MSYETNPILQRIKFSKGWKTSTFPTKISNYSQEIRVWFKIYLFLKVYLYLNGLRLLTCEVRTSNNYLKCLFLSLTKLPRKKNVKSKWKTRSLVKNMKSSLTSVQNKKGRFLLYLDLQALKNKMKNYFNIHKKKVLPAVWINKWRANSWINSSALINQRRKLVKLKYQLNWKAKKTLLQESTAFSLLNAVQIDNIFWRKKQRNFFSFLTKMQKDLFYFESHFLFFWAQFQVAKKNIALKNLVLNLTKQLKEKKKNLNKIKQGYLFCKKKTIKKNQPRIQKTFVQNLKKNKLKTQQLICGTYYAKKIKLLQREVFFSALRTKRLFFWKGNLFLNWNEALLASQQINRLHNKLQTKNKNKLLPILSQAQDKFFYLAHKKKTQIIKNNLTTFSLVKLSVKKRKVNSVKHKTFRLKSTINGRFRTFLLKKIKQNLINSNIRLKTNFLKKPHRITFKQLFLWLRFQQKKKAVRQKKKRFVIKKRKSRLKKKEVSYRGSFRQNYRNFLNINTQIKLKYLLQDLIQKYFSLPVFIKISWPLMQFKNLKFYRLLFPKYKMRLQNKKNYFLKQTKDKRTLQKKYIYVGRTTSHLKFLSSSFSTAKLKKGPQINTPRKRQTSGWHSISPNGPILNIYKKKLKKKNKYLTLKAKDLKKKSEKRLHWAAKAPFISELLTTLTLFVKYLDPQPVADHIAKLIEKTKNHTNTLKLIESLLRTLYLKRGLGYRIALIGRLNSAKKSKTLYLRKLNRNRSRQTFSKKVNFAMAHARARIGTFAIKIWAYA